MPGVPLFGDMPENDRLRPAGHSKIDLTIRWVHERPDGLYLQSRYGMLRICPVSKAAVRVSFRREDTFDAQKPIYEKNGLQYGMAGTRHRHDRDSYRVQQILWIRILICM